MSNPLRFYAAPVPAKGYQSYSATAVFECSPKRSGQPPQTVPVVLKWNDYQNLAGTATPLTPVSINLQGGTNGSPIDSIRSVTIDNLSCPSSLTLFFPDTGYEVVCPPYSTTRAMVATGGFQAITFMELDTKNLGTQSTVFFNNYNSDPADNGDSVVTINEMWSSGAPFSINFTRPHANGDRWERKTLDLTKTGAASQISIFNGPADGYNFLVLSEIHFRTLVNYTAGATITRMNAALIDSAGASTLNWSWYPRNDIDEISGNNEYLQVVNTQALFSSFIGLATYRKWFLQNNIAGIGTAECDLIYTSVNLTNFQ